MPTTYPALPQPGDPCPNCQAALPQSPPAHYCPQCGQETALQPPTLLQFVHEFFTHYGSAGGLLWRTLAVLLRRPGGLTLDYLAGQRKRYIPPMRLYLTASFAFFLIAGLLGQHRLGDALQVQIGADGKAPAASAAEAARAGSAPVRVGPVHVDGDLHEEKACIEHPGSCNWIDTQAARFALKARKIEDSQGGDGLTARMLASAPYAVFVMLPLFAGLMQGLYWRRRRAYGEHFVFSLHLHSFWFLALLLLSLLPKGLVWIPGLAIPVYGCMAMHAVYRGRWWPTLLRASLISLVYSLLLAFAAAGLALWAVIIS